MLLRSFKLPPSLLLLFVLLGFFGWQLSQGTTHENDEVGRLVIPKDGAKQGPRIALMTFVTEQRSYLHLSLKNKDRKRDQKLSAVGRALTHDRLCAPSRL